jgi:predicted PurR-regulated permease PerM
VDTSPDGGGRRDEGIADVAAAPIVKQPIVIQPRFVLEAVAWVVLGLTALLVIGRGRHMIELVVLAVVIALLLHAPIEALDRRLPRWAAITVVVLAGMLATGGLLALGTVQLDQEIDVVGASVDERISRVDPESALGEFLVEGRVAERIDDRLDAMPTQILIGSPDPADGARLGLEALLVLVLAVYALVNGPKLIRGLAGGDTPSRWRDHLSEGVAAGADQVRRLLAAAAINGLVGLAVAYAFGLPGTSVLAIWVGVWAVVPIFGPVVGYAPLVVLASLDGWSQAVAVGAIAGAVAVGSWYADRRGYAGSGSGSRLGPLGLTIALVIGLRFGWLTGPLVAIFLAAAALSTLAAVARAEPRRASAGGVGREWEGDESRGVPVAVWRRLDTRSSARATAIVVAVVAAIAFVSDLAPVPVWVIVGVTLSIALDPLVDWIADHSPLGRGASIGAVIVGLLALVAALLVFAVPSVAQSIRDLDDQLPQIAADLEQLPIIGDDLARRGIADRIQTTAEDLPSRLASDTGPIEGALRSIGDGLIATFWVLLITVAALLDGRRVRRGLRVLTSPHRREQFDRVDEIASRVIARYAVGSVAVAAIAGLATFTIALVGGVPLAPLIGLWAGLTNFIPQVGGYLGAVPLMVLALTTGTTKGLIILGVYVLYMQLENRIIQPVIVSKAVNIPPFVAMVAVLIAGAAAGVVGAILVTPLIAVVVSLRSELRPSSSPVDAAEPDHSTLASR